MLANQAGNKRRPYPMLSEQSADPLGLGDPQQRIWPLAYCDVPAQIILRCPPAAECNAPDNSSIS